MISSLINGHCSCSGFDRGLRSVIAVLLGANQHTVLTGSGALRGCPTADAVQCLVLSTVTVTGATTGPVVQDLCTELQLD